MILTVEVHIAQCRSHLCVGGQVVDIAPRIALDSHLSALVENLLHLGWQSGERLRQLRHIGGLSGEVDILDVEVQVLDVAQVLCPTLQVEVEPTVHCLQL